MFFLSLTLHQKHAPRNLRTGLVSSPLHSLCCNFIQCHNLNDLICTLFSFVFEVELIYNVVLVAGVQQSDSDTCVYIYLSFPDPFPL